MDELELMKKRFAELADRADRIGKPVWSDFLDMAGQDALLTQKRQIACGFTFWGGYENAERQLACFGEFSPDSSPAVIIKITPRSEKFADALTHRDFLGSLMALGIKRETLGDIIISENCGYVICLETIADFILSQLEKVKHTSVKCETTDSLPESIAKSGEIISVNVPSLRLDAFVAAVYRLSRSESQHLFSQDKIFVNSRIISDTSYTLKENDIVSVRGFGRFSLSEISGKTKKDRLRTEIIKY